MICDVRCNPARWRVIVTSFAVVAFGSTGVFAALTVAPLVAVALTGSTALSGVPTAGIGVGSVVGATMISRTAAHRGRRAGLLLGYAIGATGAALAVLAVIIGTFPLFVVGMILVGPANSAILQTRFAAADVSPVKWRTSILSWVLWAATIGAMAGPTMVAPTARLLSTWAVPPLGAGSAVGVMAFALGVLCCTALPRREHARLLDESLSPPSTAGPTSQRRTGVGEESSYGSPRTGSSRMIFAAVTTMVVAQVVLASIQTMTPVHAVTNDVELSAVGVIMSAHIVGMYALAPIAGWAADRIGSLSVIVAGLIMLFSASLVAGQVVVGEVWPLAATLFVLGLGWSLAFVAASGALTHEASFVARARQQGLADSLVFAGATLAILGSGVVVSTVGFRNLCMVAAALLVVPAAAIAWLRRAPAAPDSAEDTIDRRRRASEKDEVSPGVRTGESTAPRPAAQG